MPDVDSKIDAKDDDSKSSVVKRDGEIVRDFLTHDDALAQAKAIGKGAHVVPTGVAFHVADKDE
jgi:hypothetical protein